MKKLLALLLAAAMVFTFAACADNSAQTPDPTDTESPAPSDAGSPSPSSPEPSDSPEPDTEPLGVGFLKGPTGMGAAYLMENNEAGYDIVLETDPTVVTSAVISGELDIAAVPTNVAAALYNKTNGAVRIAAINTMGVLYILENGNSVQNMGDLAGKTLYATGQGSNPEYVLNYILDKNGLEPGLNITVEYLASDELTTRMAAGELEVCMLPVPAATTVLVKNPDVREAIDLTEEWSSISRDGSILTQGCIVVSADVTDAQISEFLSAYSESIAYMSNAANIDAAAELAVKHGIVGAAPIAKAALPKCGITFITGADTMREYLAGYYQVLYAADPASIGGSVPDDAFYWES